MSTLKVMGIVGIRSGSKGVIDKNVRPLLGKPLVGWILETAKKSSTINRLVVSTDSEEYATIARAFGAETPILRPQEFAEDTAPEYLYVRHMLDHLKDREGYEPDIVVRMMATVPLQTANDIDTVVGMLEKNDAADSAVVIAEARQHPMKALKITSDDKGVKRLVTYFSENGREVTPIARQSYERAYFRANIIASRLGTIYATESLTGDSVLPHIIPQERALDIDSETDFLIAELLLKNASQ